MLPADTFVNDLAIAHGNRARGARGNLGIVRHHDDRRALAPELVQQIDDNLTVA
jgi:hypothetical protein